MLKVPPWLNDPEDDVIAQLVEKLLASDFYEEDEVKYTGTREIYTLTCGVLSKCITECYIYVGGREGGETSGDSVRVESSC